jgi:hypothetical protein
MVSEEYATIRELIGSLKTTVLLRTNLLFIASDSGHCTLPALTVGKNRAAAMPHVGGIAEAHDEQQRFAGALFIPI